MSGADTWSREFGEVYTVPILTEANEGITTHNRSGADWAILKWGLTNKQRGGKKRGVEYKGSVRDEKKDMRIIHSRQGGKVERERIGTG